MPWTLREQDGGVSDAVERVAALVPAAVGEDCVRVAVDGVDGAGKTTFARVLAAALRRRGRPVVQVSVDDFHQPRAVRHARGRSSPEGFWLDSFDYARLLSDVLVPLGPGGSRRFRPAAHELATDRVLEPPTQIAAPASVVVVDGLFLHRDELVQHWSFSVFLEVPFAVSVARVAARDGTSAAPDHSDNLRYVGGQQLYFAACEPWSRASLVIDHA
jgi:uridine kinase